MPSVSAARVTALLGSQPFARPAYRDLAERLRMLVLDGRLADGVRLPSERDLAESLGLSRTTTTRAYAELRDRGLTIPRRGAGSIVRVPFTESAVSSLIRDPADPDTIALTYSAPTASPGLAKAFETALTRLPGALGTTGYLPDGLPQLRELIAARYAARGLPTDPAQIVVTNGAMGAISLIARAALGPGSRALVEGLSYAHAYDTFVASGARLVSLPAGDDPWDTEALTGALRGPRPQLAYLIPDFHNPTGLVMDERARGIWARELRRHDVLPIVDETLREVNLDGTELPESLAHQHSGAILIGSASKEFWGGLRIGWARVPHTRLMSLLQARMTLDLGSSAFEQLVVAELLQSGQTTAEDRRDTARLARDHLVAEITGRLSAVNVRVPAGGLNLWLELPQRISTTLAAAADRHGLLLTPGPRFFAAAGGEQHLRLPYTSSPEILTEAVRRLAAAYDEVVGGAAATSPPTGRIDLIA